MNTYGLWTLISSLFALLVTCHQIPESTKVEILLMQQKEGMHQKSALSLEQKDKPYRQSLDKVEQHEVQSSLPLNVPPKKYGGQLTNVESN